MTSQEVLQAGNAQAATTKPPGGRRASGEVWKRESRVAPEDHLATFLGWFSIGLGLAEVITPRGFGRMIGVKPRTGLTRFMGVREIAAGIGILATPRPAGWVKARVAGDVLDLAALAGAFNTRGANRARLAGATAAVAGVTALDVICSSKLSRRTETGNQASSNPNAVRVHKTIAVNRSPEECYRFWHDFANLPRFMEHLESVEVNGEKRSHWKAKIVGGKTVEWDAEVTNDVPGEAIEWRSTGNADIENSGSVRFEPRQSGPGTLMRVEIKYDAPGGKAGALATKLFEEVSEHHVQEDLRRFKRVIETGDVPTTKGQSTGRKGGRD